MFPSTMIDKTILYTRAVLWFLKFQKMMLSIYLLQILSLTYLWLFIPRIRNKQILQNFFHWLLLKLFHKNMLCCYLKALIDSLQCLLKVKFIRNLVFVLFLLLFVLNFPRKYFPWQTMYIYFNRKELLQILKPF